MHGTVHVYPRSLSVPRPALARQVEARSGLASQPARQNHLPHPAVKPQDEHPRPAALPHAKHPEARPAAQDPDEDQPATEPEDDEEVSPGDSPTSCDGCELAGFGLAGSLWGLFGVSRKRLPRPVIRGLQPR